MIDWWNVPLTLVVFFFALCLLPLTWSIVGIACQSSVTFFILTHTHTCARVRTKTHARTKTHIHYRFESRRGQWALFSLIPSALSFVFLWHTNTHAYMCRSTHTYQTNQGSTFQDWITCRDAIFLTYITCLLSNFVVGFSLKWSKWLRVILHTSVKSKLTNDKRCTMLAQASIKDSFT